MMSCGSRGFRSPSQTWKWSRRDGNLRNSALPQSTMNSWDRARRYPSPSALIVMCKGRVLLKTARICAGSIAPSSSSPWTYTCDIGQASPIPYSMRREPLYDVNLAHDPFRACPATFESLLLRTTVSARISVHSVARKNCRFGNAWTKWPVIGMSI